jgi:hypothetical protein
VSSVDPGHLLFVMEPIKQYATEILKQHRFKQTALPQLRSLDEAWHESKSRVRGLMDAGGVSGTVKVSISPGADVYVLRKKRTVPGAVTKKRLEVFTSRSLGDADMETLRRLAQDVHLEAQAKADKERAKAEKERSSRARREEIESRKRAREEAKAEKERMREVREAANAEREQAKRRRQETRQAAAAAKEAYERRVRQVQRVIQSNSSSS